MGTTKETEKKKDMKKQRETEKKKKKEMKMEKETKKKKWFCLAPLPPLDEAGLLHTTMDMVSEFSNLS